MHFRRTFIAVASLLAGIVTSHAETLKVGATPTGVPVTFLDTKSQKITGMMIDIVSAIGREAGFDAEVQPVDWVSLIPALTSNRIDMIAAAMSITDERKKVVAFSDPVFPYGEALVVKRDDARPYDDTLAATKGGVIGVQQGTRPVPALQQMSGIGELRVYENAADMLRDLQLGRLQAVIVDRVVMAYRLHEGTFPDLKLAEGYKSQFSAPLGLAFRKSDERLVQRVNAALKILKDRGEIDAIAAKWHVE
jgi:polar amino acid transport system substrate-binding protein